MFSSLKYAYSTCKIVYKYYKILTLIVCAAEKLKPFLLNKKSTIK